MALASSLCFSSSIFRHHLAAPLNPTRFSSLRHNLSELRFLSASSSAQKEAPSEGQNGHGSVLVKDTSENSEETMVRVELHKEPTEAILYAMHELGLASRKPFKKCARVVGEVLGKFHPHGDTAVYDSLIVAWFLRLGPGSAPSLCELLLNRFRDWDSSGVVWDMLAFAYSRSEMIHDALSVIVKMKDLNLNISTPTYNYLLHNLKHTDIMWIVYNEVKDRGTHQSDHTFDILIGGLCEQSGLQDAVSFFMGVENTESWPSVVSFNTIMSRFCKLGFVDVAKSFFCLMLWTTS
ncbi:unnamed protein product [Prunus brigantina]